MEEHAILADWSESEGPLRAIAGSLPVALFQALLREDGGIDLLYVSEGSRHALGIAAEALMNHPELVLDMIQPEDRERFSATRIQLARQTAPLNWEGRIRFGVDGREHRLVRLCASARSDPAGGTIVDGIVCGIAESQSGQHVVDWQQHQLRQLASHIDRVKEEERGHVAREIHDDLGGTLTAAKIDLAWIRSHLGADQTALAEKTEAMKALLDSAIEATGRISRSLRPPVLDHGIVAAIDWQVKEFRKRMDIACEFVCGKEDIELDREYSTALFRIFQETLTNITKHAGASRVDICLDDDGNEVSLTVIDDGRGIGADDLHKSGSYGIRGMRERAGFLGGTIDIAGASDAGTQVRVRLPARRPTRADES